MGSAELSMHIAPDIEPRVCRLVVGHILGSYTDAVYRVVQERVQAVGCGDRAGI